MKVAFLIISCDAYASLWPMHFRCLDEQWSDCLYPKYLLSNRADSGRGDIVTIKVGDDVTWSANLKKALLVLKQDYDHVLATFDDLFLVDKVDNDALAGVIESFQQNKGQFLQLIKWHNKPRRVDQWIGELGKGSLYRPNCVYSLWNIDVLLDLLNDEETAWEFERKGAQRSDRFGGFFAVHDSVFNFRNVVIRGKIPRKDARRFNLKASEKIGIMTTWDQVRFFVRLWSFKLFLFLTPRKLQAPMVRAKIRILG